MSLVRTLASYEIVASGSTILELPIDARVIDAAAMTWDRSHIALAVIRRPDPGTVIIPRTFVVALDGAEFESGAHVHIRSLFTDSRLRHVFERVKP